MSVQVQADGAESSQRMQYVRYDDALRPQPLLFTAHLVLTVREGELVRAAYGVAGEDGVAMQRLLVLAYDVRFQPAAFGERQVAGGEGVVQRERFGNLARDEAVGAARHPVVKLRQKQQVTALN